MKEIGIITICGFVVGMVGTGIGGLISVFIKESHRILSFLLGLTGGFMLFIVTFHLLPEAFILGGLYFSILGIALGIGLIIFVENNINKLLKSPNMKSSFILAISIAVHNFPEGLALGSSFLTMSDLAPVLSIAMLLHNIPEGLALAIPLKINKISREKLMLYTVLIGIPTEIGAFIGAWAGMISNVFIALCLSFAGGTMLYIICDEIIPNAKTYHKGRGSSIGFVLGFVAGMILYF